MRKLFYEKEYEGKLKKELCTHLIKGNKIKTNTPCIVFNLANTFISLFKSSKFDI